MAQIQDQILFQQKSMPASEGIVNTGVNMTVLASNSLAYANNFNLLNYRLFITTVPYEDTLSTNDFASNVVSVGKSVGELKSEDDTPLAIETPNSLPINADGQIGFAITGTIYGDDEFTEEIDGLIAGQQFYSYIINGLNLYRVSGPSQGDEVYETNSITAYDENSIVEYLVTLAPIEGYVPEENTLYYLISQALNTITEDYIDIQNMYMLANDGITQEDVNYVQSSLDEANNTITNLEYQLANVTQEDGVSQVNVDESYIEGYNQALEELNVAQDQLDGALFVIVTSKSKKPVKGPKPIVIAGLLIGGILLLSKASK